MSAYNIGEAFFVGCSFGALCTVFMNWLILSLSGLSKYDELIRETRSLANSQNGIVTVTDLVFNARISPTKAKKFLEKFARQLEAEVDVTGAICYRFISSETIRYRTKEYQELINCTRSIAKYNQGIVTVTDLSFEAKITPEKARNFLEELAQELRLDGYEEKRENQYYKFTNTENINSKLLT